MARKQKQKNPHAVALGRLGGLVRSEAKQKGQSGKWSKGWSGQKPQEDHRGAAQCAPGTAWTRQESLNVLVEAIRARFGIYVIGRGDGGIRYSARTLR
jgi:hypothetical protein